MDFDLREELVKPVKVTAFCKCGKELIFNLDSKKFVLTNVTEFVAQCSRCQKFHVSAVKYPNIEYKLI
jgi:hypothetical protein